jgi:hypothetical protein
MNVKQYNPENLLNTAMTALEIAGQHVILITFKFVLKDHFPDLRGLVSVQTNSHSNYDLINSIEDPFITMMRYLVNVIQLPVHQVVNVYAIDVENYDCTDEEWNEALDLYWDLITSEFIVMDEDEAEDEYDDQQYADYLVTYMTTLINFVGQLLVLLDTGLIDFDKAWEDVCDPVIFNKDAYHDKPHAYAMGVICDLGKRLQVFQYKILQEDYDIQWLLDSVEEY